MSKSRLGSEYIPLVDEEMSKARVVVPFSRVAWFTIALPFVAFVFCVFWSVIYNFEHSTATHCKVYNFLPSVSAAIGHYRPQRDIWQLAIAMQAITRVIVFVMYYRHYKENVFTWAQPFSNIALFSYALENISLITLSFWTSDQNYALHKLSFIIFLSMSFIHMFVAYFVMSTCRNTARESPEVTALKWKWRAMMFNLFSILCAVYFFYRHNKYCEPLVYSMFALSEYAVVLGNMGFHLTVVWDFALSHIMISGNGFRII